MDTPKTKGMDMLPATQQEAKTIGSTQYFTGRPCKHGHIAPRFTANSGCSECLRLRSKDYFEANRDEALRVNREYVKANPEANRERSRRWYENNRDKAVVSSRLSRPRVAANGGALTGEEWAEIKRAANYRCLCCGRQEPEITLTIDHVVPVAWGGNSDPENIQPLCLDCNRKKSNRHVDYRTAA